MTDPLFILVNMSFFVIYSSILHSQIQQHYNGHDHVLQMSRTARQISVLKGTVETKRHLHLQPMHQQDEGNDWRTEEWAVFSIDRCTNIFALTLFHTYLLLSIIVLRRLFKLTQLFTNLSLRPKRTSMTKCTVLQCINLGHLCWSMESNA